MVILYFRPWEQQQTPTQKTENPSKPFADPIPPSTATTKQQSTPVSPNNIDDFSALPDQPLTSAEIFRRALPSVVLLTIQDARGHLISLGSGFFVDKDVVATNFHVVEGAAAGYAKVRGGPPKLNVKGTVGVDALHDLALLEVDPSSTTALPVASKLSANIGDTVYAIGNPEGLEGTVSQGIISSLRTIGSDRLLQITAPISPGSSGGPILDQTGTVIGVSFASVEKGQNLNFAIPSDYLAALRREKAELQQFTTIPRAKLRTTLLDRIGNDRPLAGVVAENLTYDAVAVQSGEFSLSVHNKLRDNISDVYGIVVFHDLKGEPIDVYPIHYEGLIPAGTAKRIRGFVNESVERLNCPERAFAYVSDPPRPPKGLVEFRILDFRVD